MQRVMITGGPGSGKSTLARQLGKKAGLPVYHIDQLAWLPGWEMRKREDTASIMHDIQKGDQWIIDGNYSGSIEDREQRADTIIFLDFPVSVRLWRVLLRIINSNGVVRPDMAPDCPERFDWDFMKFIWKTRKTYPKSGITRIKRNRGTKECHHLRRTHQVRAFLEQVSPIVLLVHAI